MTESTCPPSEVFNTPTLVRDIDRDICGVLFAQRGDNRLEHNGRRCELRPGDFVLVDSSLPFRAVHRGLRHVSLFFPPSMLPFARDQVSRLAGAAFAGDAGIGSLVSTLARRLPRHLDDPGAADAARLGTAVLDLVAVAMQERRRLRCPPR